MSTAVATAVEIVSFQPESRRADGFFSAFAQAAKARGYDVVRTNTYRGSSPWLLLWGPGAPERAKALQRHVAAGGRVLAMDLAYWDREHKARVSIDAAHPVQWVMRTPMPASRLDADRVRVADTWNPKGPIVIAGIGDKARVQYGADMVDRWERSMIRACRERWPGRALTYRKKKTGSPVPADVSVSGSQPIDAVLTGASLVITWHSNVAVDAIRMGIPVVCRDGAAAAVCPSELPETPTPLPAELRRQFLANLAWFQWSPAEAPQFWAWVEETLQ